MSGRFLVVAATEAEAAYVPAGLPLVITGIGKVPAATETASALARDPDPATLTVLNIGTAGALRDGLSGLFRPGQVLNHDFSAAAVRALGHPTEELLALGSGDPDVTLASGDLFVSDPAIRDALARQAHLVDMEGYAVAYACRRFGAGMELVKHVSDNADESAFDWPAALETSARALGEWLRTRTEA